jgi:hypothetical protein
MNDKNCPENKQQKRVIELDLWKVIVIFITAVIASAGGGVYGAMAGINSDHYALAANIEETQELKSNYREIISHILDIKVQIGEIRGELKTNDNPPTFCQR